MRVIAEVVLWVAVAAIAYTYVGYSFVMALLARFRPQPVHRADIEPTVTVVIAAYNEERGLADKLDNVLDLDYPTDRLQILVGSDASTDGTDTVVQSYRKRGVELVRVEGRRGKTAVQNRCVETARGEIVVFTDATTVLRRDSLRRLVRSFADSRVGCVGGRLIYVDRQATQVGHGGTSYWSYEAKLKSWESLANSLIGVSGCFYAVRRALYRPIEPDLISDFVIALDTYRAGYRVVYEPTAISEEETLRDAEEEMRMRIRVALRTYTALRRRRRLLDPVRHGLFAVQLISHKVLRYSVGLFLVAAYVANLVLVGSAGYTALFVLQTAFYAMAAIGHFAYQHRNAKGPLALPYYFVLANLSALVAMVRALRGESITTWEPQR